jgi:hypothetical protein
MGIRTVRLDPETERVLDEVLRATGLSVSAALKKGLLTLREEVARQAHRTAYEVYRELDLGPGGYANAPSTDTRRGVRAAVRRKVRR